MITFIRRVRMLNGHFGEAMELLKKRIAYLNEMHGAEIELMTRFGGPLGEVALVARYEDAGELELFRRKVMADLGSEHLLEELAPVLLPGQTYDEIWMSDTR